MTFSELAASTSQKGIKEIRRQRNQFWNAFKHYYESDGKTVRDDSALVDAFFKDPDHNNSTDLFIGWYDYMMAGNPLPVEVQIFQVWHWAKDIERLSPAHDKAVYEQLFPDLKSKNRSEQKRMLLREISKYRDNKELLGNPKTDPEPLILPKGLFMQDSH